MGCDGKEGEVMEVQLVAYILFEACFPWSCLGVDEPLTQGSEGPWGHHRHRRKKTAVVPTAHREGGRSLHPDHQATRGNRTAKARMMRCPS